LRVKWVKTENCIPMKELARPNYDQRSLAYLTERIRKDRFKPCYAIRVIFNKRKNRYECIDGNHRHYVATLLGLKKIPIIDETGNFTRKEAIAEGIKANRSHAHYNAMDISSNLNSLLNANSKEKKEKSKGRPETVGLSKLAEQTGMSKKSISQYLQLQRLPKEVQTFVGHGKLGMSLALILLKLDKTPHAQMITELAEEVVSNGISRRELVRRVDSIRNRGYYQEDAKVCAGCKRTFSKDRLSYTWLCPECVNELREGNLGKSVSKDRTKAMQTYLKVNNFVSKLEKNGQEVPNWLRLRVEELHQIWKEAK